MCLRACGWPCVAAGCSNSTGWYWDGSNELKCVSIDWGFRLYLWFCYGFGGVGLAGETLGENREVFVGTLW